MKHGRPGLHEMPEIVSRALAEDIGARDVTSEALIPETEMGRAMIVTRAAGVIAGIPMAEEVFRQVSASVTFAEIVEDGATVESGTRIAEVKGPVRALLAGERVALNFLQRLSGIATLTRRCVDEVRDTDARILDTRKTTPCMRAMEKYAVRMGGGENHRMGLYDQVLIKDNHLRALLDSSAGSGKAANLPEAAALAVKRARAHVHEDMVVEVEVESLEMFDAALKSGADIILLDNMSLDEMRQAANAAREHRRSTGSESPLTEASGGLRISNLAEVARTGVDFISLGMLTHSAPALDIALDFVEEA